MLQRDTQKKNIVHKKFSNIILNRDTQVFSQHLQYDFAAEKRSYKSILAFKVSYVLENLMSSLKAFIKFLASTSCLLTSDLQQYVNIILYISSRYSSINFIASSFFMFTIFWHEIHCELQKLFFDIWLTKLMHGNLHQLSFLLWSHI